MTEDSSISIVLTPVQLAAILQGESISTDSTLSNRMWGGLTLAAGVVEMVGGAALCVVPEPTGLTKAGCVLLGVHGSDLAAAGLHEVRTAQQTPTLTERGLTELATKLGATPGSGQTLGLAVEIAVPVGLSGALKAVRVSRVIAGRMHLSRHEASVLGGAGGHTLAKHVGKTKEFLEARLLAEPYLPAASTFHSVAAAEQAVNGLMRSHVQTVATWAASAHNGAKLGLSGSASGNLGVVLVRGATDVVEGTVVRVVLKKQPYNGMAYFVLTAYLVIQ